MGKSGFLHLFDGEEKLQVYVRKDAVSEVDFELYRLLDLGDFLGVEGKLFRTSAGELTLLAEKLTFLTKALLPLPEKWHGLQDKELRYRQRYLDLIANDDARRVFALRSDLIREMRLFFYEHDYREVETPMMQAIPGGASARPFVTRHNALGLDLYLRIAPELFLKRLLVGGMPRVFELNRNFRNEGIDMNHNPEFTMIEWYQILADFEDNMALTEQLFSRLNERFLPNGQITWNGRTLSMVPPFRKARFMELIAQYAQVPEAEIWTEEGAAALIRRRIPGEDVPPTFAKMLDLLFDHFVQEHLWEPVFVTHHPRALSPLAKPARSNPEETERFELFAAGMELANAYSELNDPIDQRQRFEDQLADKARGDDEAQSMDEDFVTALMHGMPPASGEGVGIDRLVMLYSGAASIKEVILFPALRPKEQA